MNNNKEANMKSDRLICSETSYPHDSTLTKRFVVKITVERCDKILVAASQMFDRVKFVTCSVCLHEKLEKVE
jgi:hypothetical protein